VGSQYGSDMMGPELIKFIIYLLIDKYQFQLVQLMCEEFRN
jgi:hypothetical protein